MSRTLLLSSLLLVLSACGDDADAPADSGVDAATRVDASVSDAGTTPDSGTTADAGTDAGPSDAGPAPECALNSDCAADRRCECTEEGGCFCQVGVRGTGVNGVDICEDGNDCASSLCIEGSEKSALFFCSDVCATDEDCGENLPQCTDVAFVGRICVRATPDA